MSKGSSCTDSFVSVTPELAKVGVRVPPFSPEDPALWFAQMEGQFSLAGITVDSTKFYYVSAQLDHHIAKEVKDIITNPPSENKYLKLKTELIRRLSASQERKVRQLLTHEELGDRKPSQFLRHLQTLAGTDVPEDFLRTLWAGRLPTNLQTLVASQRKLSLSDVAELADQVYDIVPSTPQVATTEIAMDEMSRQISELTKQMSELRAQLGNYRHRSRSRTRVKQRFRSKSRDTSMCWYHNRFGNKATRCTAPCSFKTLGNATGSRK